MGTDNLKIPYGKASQQVTQDTGGAASGPKEAYQRPAPQYEVISRRDTDRGPKGTVVGQYSTRQRARRAVDKYDNEYGAYAHHIRPIDPGTGNDGSD